MMYGHAYVDHTSVRQCHPGDTEKAGIARPTLLCFLRPVGAEFLLSFAHHGFRPPSADSTRGYNRPPRWGGISSFVRSPRVSPAFGGLHPWLQSSAPLGRRAFAADSVTDPTNGARVRIDRIRPVSIVGAWRAKCSATPWGIPPAGPGRISQNHRGAHADRMFAEFMRSALRFLMRQGEKSVRPIALPRKQPFEGA